MKNQKAIAWLVLMGLLLWIFPLYAVADESSGDFTYTASGKTCTITGYKGSGSVLTVPAELNGYTVRTIGQSAFSECKSLQEIILPDTVTQIGDDAFFECTNLISVFIPKNVTRLHEFLFSTCSNLKRIDVDENNKKFSSEDGVLFNKDKTELLVFPMGKSGSYTVPLGVTRIGDWAFSSCDGLTDITLPDSVTTLGNGVFAGCSGLTRVALPNSVTETGTQTFESCQNLTQVISLGGVTVLKNSTFMFCDKLADITLSDSISHIESQAFFSCAGLKNVTFSNNTTHIEASAFFNCDELASITLPGNLTHIEPGAFNDCDKLENLTLPDSVTYVGGNPAIECDAFKGFYVDQNSQNFSSEDGVLFSKDKTQLLACPPQTSGTYTVPEGVSSIGEKAFFRCDKISVINLPSTLRRIEPSAFQYCTGLTEINLPKGITYLGARAFDGCAGLTRIVLPDTVTSLEDNTFSQCSNLTSVTFPPSITQTGFYVFAGCDDLTIYGTAGTYAQTYASDNNIPFVSIEHQKGDVDGNGEINAADALKALQHSVNLIELTSFIAQAADVNEDEEINANDALLILQYSVRLIDRFPVKDTLAYKEKLLAEIGKNSPVPFSLVYCENSGFEPDEEIALITDADELKAQFGNADSPILATYAEVCDDAFFEERAVLIFCQWYPSESFHAAVDSIQQRGDTLTVNYTVRCGDPEVDHVDAVGFLVAVMEIDAKTAAEIRTVTSQGHNEYSTETYDDVWAIGMDHYLS